MALRNWTVRRMLGLWTGWMAGLLVLLLAGVVLSPTGVSIAVSPAGLSLGARVAFALAGLVVACLPPAVLTYAWYLARLRAWSEGNPAGVGPHAVRHVLADVARARELGDVPVRDPGQRGHESLPVRRDDGAA